MNKNNLFDQKIRDAINKYEVPFDDTAWKNIENKINVPAKTPVFNLKPWIISAAVAASLVIGYFAFQSSTDETIEHVEQKKVEQVVPESDINDDKEITNDLEEKQLVVEEKSTEETPLPIEEKDSPENLPLIVDETNVVEPKDVEQTNLDDVIYPKEDNIVDNGEDTSKETLDSELVLSVHINKETLCKNEALILSLNKTNVPIEVKWNFGDGYTCEGPNANHIYAEPGTYILKLQANSVLNESIVKEESYTIVVNPIPDSQFEIEKSANMNAMPQVSFESMSEHVSSIEWKFKDENIANSEVVEKMYNSKGSYNVGLIVKNQFQCSDTLYKELVIENDFNLMAPNAFSPNGDGVNDTFMPKALAELNQNFTLQVFDPRSSQVIFESHDVSNQWNGTMMNNGNTMEEGAYAWSVITEDGSVYRGTILITTK